MPPFAAQCAPAPSNVREEVNALVGVSVFFILIDEESRRNPMMVMTHAINAVAFVL